MNSKNLFSEKINELEVLPDTPDVFWYPSAGKDFRGNVFLTDFHIDHEKQYHGREYEKPDLFIFNCLGIEEIKELKNNITEGNPLFEDEMTKITGKNFKEFGIEKEKLNLGINPDFVDVNKVELPEGGKEAFYFEVEIEGKKQEYRENQKILYLEHENIDVFEKIILKGYFNVLYLCATREGCGMGNCKKSIIEYVYEDGYPGFYIDKDFKPKYAIVFHDFVKEIFDKKTSDSNSLKAQRYQDYIWETDDRLKPDSTIYKINYMNYGQKQYDEWSKETPVNHISRLNAPFINEAEKRFILFAKPNKVLDIGPGDGVRLFEFLKEQEIKFLGLEKFPRLIENSPYKENIIIGDITDINISELDNESIDCITILGGTMNGIFGLDKQRIAWENIANILPPKGKVIFDALLIEGFENKDSLGERKLFPDGPPQFFLSEKELNNIWKECYFSIIKSEDFDIPAPHKLRYYLLEKDENNN